VHAHSVHNDPLTHTHTRTRVGRTSALSRVVGRCLAVVIDEQDGGRDEKKEGDIWVMLFFQVTS